MLGAGFATLAAIQGHWYAGGAIMAMAHDVRIMREDRGYFCLPEVDLGVQFTAGMSSLTATKLSRQAARQAMVFGQRFTGADAIQAGIVHGIVAEADLLPRALARAAELAAKSGPLPQMIKRELYAPTLAALLDPASAGVDGLFTR